MQPTANYLSVRRRLRLGGVVRSAALAFIVGVMAASAARAQVLCSWCAILQGRYEGGAVQLEFSWAYWDMRTEAAGFDLYRGSLGTPCAEGVRVNESVLPLPPFPTLEPAGIFTDPNVEPGHGYWYEIRPVDAQRHQIPGEFVVRSSVTTGTALLFRGRLAHDWQPGGLSRPLVTTGHSCDADLCFADGVVSGNGAAGYADQGTTVEIYGEAGTVLNFAQDWAQELIATSVTPYSCLRPITPSAWGSVKSLYRE